MDIQEGLDLQLKKSLELLEQIKKLEKRGNKMAEKKTIIIENVRGHWIVSESTTGAFQEEGTGYVDGALIKLEISKAEGLCHHPNNTVICSYCGK